MIGFCDYFQWVLVLEQSIQRGFKITYLSFVFISGALEIISFKTRNTDDHNYFVSWKSPVPYFTLKFVFPEIHVSLIWVS